MGTIAGLAAFSSIATDLYLPALPNLAEEMHATEGAAQLTLTATFVGIMIGQLVFGPMSDSVGRRRLVIAMTLATVASTLACMLAPSMAFLTVARLALGITGGAGMVIGRAIAGDIVKGAEAARFFSMLLSITMIAPLIGPLIGGVLLNWTHTWRAAFAFLLLFVFLLSLAIFLFVPETLPLERRHSGGLAELRRGAGLLFRDRVFVGYVLTQAFGFAAMFAFLASSSFVFQDMFGLSPAAFGLVFSGIIVSLFVTVLVNRRLLIRFSVRRLLIIALAIGTVASFLLIPVLAVSSPSMWLTIALLLAVIGTRGAVAANAMALGLERSPLVGTASAILGAAAFSGALISTPMLSIMPFNVGLAMALTITVCSALALTATVLLTRVRAVDAGGSLPAPA